MSIIGYYSYKSRFSKNTLILYVIILISLVMLGQGRVSTATAITIVVLWILLTKNIKKILAFITVTVVAITILNSNKSLISNLPFQAQRAISFIPVDDSLDIGVTKNTSGSDLWHKDLQKLGFSRWFESPRSMVFGNIIDPTDAKDFKSLNYNRMLVVAANTARYENALWTVLATLGLVGFFLYARLFWLLLKEIVPEVIKKGINNYYGAVYGVAFLSMLLFIIFIWIRGSFPGFELLFCAMGKMLYDDTKKARISTTGQTTS